MKKRWISLYVENDVGVLARIAGLFSGKSYNLRSLTVGVTEDETVSRMTISLTSDDRTFEQVKKQLNRSVEVIKVVDLSAADVRIRELLFVRITHCSEPELAQLFRIAAVFGVTVADCDTETVLLECTQSERRNDELLALLRRSFGGRLRIVRGGGVAADAVSLPEPL